MKLSRLSILVLLALGQQAMAATAPIEPSMVDIPAGQFMMGAADDKQAAPVHQVKVKAFAMAKYLVTVKEFRQFVTATGYVAPEKCFQMAGKNWFEELPGSWKSHTLTSSEFEPAVCIGAAGAQAYVQWLAKETGKKYRLPSEAEWEYAARAGTTGAFFFGANDDKKHDLACQYGNIADRAAEAAIKRDFDGLESIDHVGVSACDDGADYATIVGTYAPNPWGLYDIVGNAMQYVQDCYHDNYEGAPEDGSAWTATAAACDASVLRGGPWHWPALGSAVRNSLPTTFVGALEGFRVALDVDAASKALATRPTLRFAAELAAAQADERRRRATLPVRAAQ